MGCMKVLLIFLCLVVLLEAVSAGDGNKGGGGKRGRMKKKKYRGQPNIIIFVVDDVSAIYIGKHTYMDLLPELLCR